MFSRSIVFIKLQKVLKINKTLLKSTMLSVSISLNMVYILINILIHSLSVEL